MTFFGRSASFNFASAMLVLPAHCKQLSDRSDGMMSTVFNDHRTYVVVHPIDKNRCIKPASVQPDMFWFKSILTGLESKNCLCQRVGGLLRKKDTVVADSSRFAWMRTGP